MKIRFIAVVTVDDNRQRVPDLAAAAEMILAAIPKDLAPTVAVYSNTELAQADIDEGLMGNGSPPPSSFGSDFAVLKA
jgi:hypothetical protein